MYYFRSPAAPQVCSQRWVISYRMHLRLTPVGCNTWLVIVSLDNVMHACNCSVQGALYIYVHVPHYQ